jgi:hypothetical protein
MKIRNSQGKIYYGMHFYPGVAEYREEGKEPYRVFINENTIRKMSPTFAGRPIYVDHVDGVETTSGKLTDSDADGFVVESFFNSADGKTWAKFIVISEKAEAAIRKGWRLSNAYVPKSFGAGGQWNGVDFEKEVMDGEYEHLAIVPNPRYEESVILTPEEFKEYNAEKQGELLKFANSKDPKKETTKMAFSFFKKTKVENSKDLDGMMIELPKSKKEVSIEDLIKNADEMASKEGKPAMCNMEDMVNVDGKDMSLNDLLALHKQNSEELAKMKGAGGEDKPVENDEEDEEAKKKALELAEHEEEEIAEEDAVENEDDEKKKKEEEEVKKNAKKVADKKHFDALKNAHVNPVEETLHVDLQTDRLARGKSRYGSA